MPPTPNILVCTWHDTGRHFGCYGQKSVHSPNVDRLAADGWLWERAFCASPKCSPSRGAMLTGFWPQSNGLYYLCHGNFGYRLHDGVRTLAQILGAHGYHTVLHGFQHETNPRDGADRLGHHEAFNHRPQGPPTWQVPPCDVIARDAAGWLRQRVGQGGDRPFFMQLGFFETHRKYDFGGCQPDREHGVHLPPWIEPHAELEADMADLQGAIRKADAAVGTVLDALESTGLAEDTLVNFTVDHGLDLVGSKGTCYEPGMEIAMVMRWPAGGLKGGVRRPELLSNVDIVPTLLDLAGLPAEPGVQGHSFARLIRGETGTPPRRFVPGMIEEGEKRSIRNDRWKLIRNFTQLRGEVRPVRRVELSQPYMSGGAQPLFKLQPIPHVQLFDLETDPLETTDRSGDPECAEPLAELDAALWRWMESVGDPLLALPHEPRWRDQLRDYLNWRGSGEA